MKLKQATLYLSIGISLFLVTAASAGDAPRAPGKLTAREIMERYYAAFYAQANDFRIEAKLELFEKDGKRRTRRLTTWRLDLDPEGTRQKVLIYFHEPLDVRGLTIMVWKYPNRNDDRWMFIPALDLVRRLSALDYSQSFVGSDFTYEDGTGRDVALDSHRLIREEELDGIPCYVVESTPGSKASWTRQIIWVAKKTFLPRKREYYNVQGKLERVFSPGPVEMIKAKGGDETVPTMTTRKMENLLTGHYSVFTFLSVNYNLGLKEEDFKERHLRRLPRSWIQ
jgi:hypothetical protein